MVHNSNIGLNIELRENNIILLIIQAISHAAIIVKAWTFLLVI